MNDERRKILEEVLLIANCIICDVTDYLNTDSYKYPETHEYLQSEVVDLVSTVNRLKYVFD